MDGLIEQGLEHVFNGIFLCREEDDEWMFLVDRDPGPSIFYCSGMFSKSVAMEAVVVGQWHGLS